MGINIPRQNEGINAHFLDENSTNVIVREQSPTGRLDMKEKMCLIELCKRFSETYMQTTSTTSGKDKNENKHTQQNERYIGLNVYYVRKSILHISQEEFGYMAGMSKDTVSNIERGVYIPSIQNLVNIYFLYLLFEISRIFLRFPT